MNESTRDSRDTTLLRALAEALPEPVLAVASDGRILAANGPARQLLPAVRLGDQLALALRSPDVLDGIARVRSEGRAEFVQWLERVPVERLFDVHIAGIDAAGYAAAVILTLRDMTEVRRVERMRVDFVANASHELRTPLASLLGFVETLQGAARDDTHARERFLKIMHEQAARMSRLVDDLLSLSRIEQNLHLRPSKAVDLALVTRHIADTLARMAKDSNVALRIEAADEVLVTGDHDELARVAENLIENAIKYGSRDDGGAAAPVEIDVRATGRNGVLTVRDHGAGIAREHLPRLTERFYRIDVGQSRSKGGTGLGLALVKHIMAHHRGRMTVDSAWGEGATFKVMIPLHLK